jgi:hypothetical protein
VTPNGYQAVADAITGYFRLVPPLDRRQVYVWNLRRTENRNGHAFPSPVGWGDRGPDFDIDACLVWYAQGVPGPRGQGFETPAERNARMADPGSLESIRSRNAERSRGIHSSE